MIIHCFIRIILIVCLFDSVISLRARTPIFGRRMRQIDSSLRSAVEENDIMPDVIDTIPINTVQVRYPSGVEVNLGKELTPKSVKDQPSVEWPIEEGTNYTLVMIDPDVPNMNGPTKGEVKHWLVVNIPGTQISNGQTVANYRGSGPSLGSGLHRYIFLVYKQTELMADSDIASASQEGRFNFRIREFAKKYKLGEPIALNFYLAQYDDYVGLMKNKTKVKSISKDESRINQRRAQLLDWAPRKAPKAPKFPQMICMNYDRYLEIRNLLNDNKEE